MFWTATLRPGSSWKSHRHRSCAITLRWSYAGQVRGLKHPRWVASRQTACLVWGGGRGQTRGMFQRRACLGRAALFSPSSGGEVPVAKLWARCKPLVKLWFCYLDLPFQQPAVIFLALLIWQRLCYNQRCIENDTVFHPATHTHDSAYTCRIRQC